MVSDGWLQQADVDSGCVHNVIMAPRTPWLNFPEAYIHADEIAVKRHPSYQAAKIGDGHAAAQLVNEFLDDKLISSVKLLIGHSRPTVVSVHALEKGGINAIPEALADALSVRLGLPVDGGVVQTNVVSHTGADGFSRIARQALFDGEVEPGRDYLIVDDFVGQGGTLANLKGYIESSGGNVVGAVVLTGRPYSSKLTLTKDRLNALREKHGPLEDWWKQQFGFGFDALTESEARYLQRTPDADTIRNRVTSAKQTATGSTDNSSDQAVSANPPSPPVAQD